MAILITGGAGFVGSNLAKLYKKDFPQTKVICLDNLKRRGAETNLPEFQDLEIEFVHGDIRSPSDFADLSDDIDLVIEASAEPSVHAGNNGSADYLLDTNLWGTKNCLEFIRQRKIPMIFLSTSRVYSIDPLTKIELEEGDTRFEISANNNQQGLSKKGIAENYDVLGFRSLYGATKLCSEFLIQEYVSAFDLKVVRNRCGVIAGQGQWGKVDQGVFTLWMANHYFNKGLGYTGFGGKGKQVRDLLHPQDLYRFVRYQQDNLDKLNGEVFNLGGGRDVSTSLLELTKLCQQITGNKIEMGSDPKTAKVDIPLYLSDYSKFETVSGLVPEFSVKDIMENIFSWIQSNEKVLKKFFG